MTRLIQRWKNHTIWFVSPLIFASAAVIWLTHSNSTLHLAQTQNESAGRAIQSNKSDQVPKLAQ